jgi:hypothetical protein
MSQNSGSQNTVRPARSNGEAPLSVHGSVHGHRSVTNSPQLGPRVVNGDLIPQPGQFVVNGNVIPHGMIRTVDAVASSDSQSPDGLSPLFGHLHATVMADQETATRGPRSPVFGTEEEQMRRAYNVRMGIANALDDVHSSFSPVTPVPPIASMQTLQHQPNQQPSQTRSDQKPDASSLYHSPTRFPNKTGGSVSSRDGSRSKACNLPGHADTCPGKHHTHRDSASERARRGTGFDVHHQYGHSAMMGKARATPSPIPAGNTTGTPSTVDFVQTCREARASLKGQLTQLRVDMMDEARVMSGVRDQQVINKSRKEQDKRVTELEYLKRQYEALDISSLASEDIDLNAFRPTPRRALRGNTPPPTKVRPAGFDQGLPPPNPPPNPPSYSHQQVPPHLSAPPPLQRVEAVSDQGQRFSGRPPSQHDNQSVTGEDSDDNSPIGRAREERVYAPKSRKACPRPSPPRFSSPLVQSHAPRQYVPDTEEAGTNTSPASPRSPPREDHRVLSGSGPERVKVAMIAARGLEDDREEASKIKTMPPFEGKGCDNIVTWIDHFERYCKAKGYIGEDAARILASHLGDTVKLTLFVLSKEDQSSPRKMLDHLLKKYGPETQVEKNRMLFNTRRQAECETYREFLDGLISHRRQGWPKEEGGPEGNRDARDAIITKFHAALYAPKVKEVIGTGFMVGHDLDNPRLLDDLVVQCERADRLMRDSWETRSAKTSAEGRPDACKYCERRDHTAATCPRRKSAVATGVCLVTPSYAAPGGVFSLFVSHLR